MGWNASYRLSRYLYAFLTAISSTPTPIIDRLGRIIAVLAGTPTTGGYEDDLLAAYDEMNREAKAAGLGVYAANPHKRGRFHAYNCGVTLGMGSAYPVLLQPGDMAPVLAMLLRHQGVKRMARFQDRYVFLFILPARPNHSFRFPESLGPPTLQGIRQCSSYNRIKTEHSLELRR